MQQAKRDRHGFPRRVGTAANWSSLCPRSRDQGNRDASLSAPAARARHSAAPHADMLRGSCTGSAPRPGAAIRAAAPPRTRRRSSGYRGRSRGKSAPGPRSVRSYRADSSLRPPSCPRTQHWTTPCGAGIKARQTRPHAREHAEGPGFCPGMCPGLRLFGVYAQDSAAPSAAAGQVPPSRGAARRRYPSAFDHADSVDQFNQTEIGYVPRAKHAVNDSGVEARQSPESGGFRPPSTARRDA